MNDFERLAFGLLRDAGVLDGSGGYDLTRLMSGTTYELGVVAKGQDAYADSQRSETVEFTTEGEPPEPYKEYAMGKLIQNPGCFDYTNAGETAIKSGDVVIVGDIVGVAIRAIAPGETGAVSVEGIYELDKDDAAITLGAEVYINTTSGKASATSTGGKKAGYAVAAAAATDTTVQVILR